VAICADWRLHDPLGNCLSVNTTFKFRDYVRMAASAQAWNSRTKLRSLGAFDFVRFAVAGSAVRRCAVTVLYRLGVSASCVVTGHIGMAACACRLRNTFRMWVFFVFCMAALARNGRVHLLFHFVAYVTMAGDTELIIGSPNAALRRFVDIGGMVLCHRRT